jgi:tRNA(Ile2) C34 agmatinyltransferase TiaS
MKVYVGFDDTDVAGADRGTGKFARWFEQKIPEGAMLHGVIRQQLPVLEGIPYTSQNSSACIILDNIEPSQVQDIIDRGAAHIREHFIDGSDPGLCVVPEDGSSVATLIEFGRSASTRIVTQKEAMKAVNGFHLSGHGGTNDGIIGAVAGVGLTLSGWSGRFIEFNGLRDFGRNVRVGDLEARGIRVLCTDRNAMVPGMDDMVDTQDWLRPRLWSGGPVLPVEAVGFGAWRALGAKNKI